jgi:hypothetical protein
VPHYKEMLRKVMEMGCDTCHAQAGATDDKYWSDKEKKYIDTSSLPYRNGRIACDTRHSFSLVEARKPEACHTCHMGPDHPNYEAYMASKHGSIYVARGKDWDWTQPLPQARWDAPTCAENREREAEEQLVLAAGTIETIMAGLTTERFREAFAAAGPVVEVYRSLGRRPPEPRGRAPA